MENVVSESSQEIGEIGFKHKAAAYLELTKPRIAFMLVLTAAAGFYLGAGASFDWKLFFHSMFGIALLAFGVAALNQYIERDLDALMARTSRRPLPSGRLSKVQALAFGTLMCVSAEFYLWYFVNTLTAVLGLSVIIGYVFVYTPLKTRTTASTAIGAIPGAMPPLMGWTSASGEFTVGAWALFLLLFLWQFPHFFAIAWMYKEEYAAAGIKMLPVVEPEGKITTRQILLFTVMLIPISLAPFFLGFSGMIFLIGALLLGAWFMYAAIQTARLQSVEQARKLMFVSVAYLPLIFLIMVLNH